MTPLDEFATRWNASAPPLPFVDVVNSGVDLDTMPARWGAAYLESETRSDITLGSRPWVAETGNVVVALVAKSGKGGAVLDDAVSWLRATFAGYKTQGFDLAFLGVVGPLEVNPEGDGVWWRLSFLVPYVLQSQRQEPPP